MKLLYYAVFQFSVQILQKIIVIYFNDEHSLLISLLQYMGNQVSDRVHLKCIELLYGWSQVLSHEPKIKEAYQMLKRQGIIKYDPVHIDKVGLIPPLLLCLHLPSSREALCNVL